MVEGPEPRENAVVNCRGSGQGPRRVVHLDHISPSLSYIKSIGFLVDH